MHPFLKSAKWGKKGFQEGSHRLNQKKEGQNDSHLHFSFLYHLSLLSFYDLLAPPYLLTCLPPYLLTFLPPYLLTFLPPYLLTFLPPYLLTSLPPCGKQLVFGGFKEINGLASPGVP
jgi:hypothetical protein